MAQRGRILVEMIMEATKVIRKDVVTALVATQKWWPTSARVAERAGHRCGPDRQDVDRLHPGHEPSRVRKSLA